MKHDYSTIQEYKTLTKLVKQTTKHGRTSFHVITTILDKDGNDLPLLTGYANIAKLETIAYATNDKELLQRIQGEAHEE